ncbi:MAG: hypothetical protein JWO71_2311 [Candidatus Acidoferrum typicum]|nr:hypothetical protein [Candidatus Acidoferrum typicum]
MKKRILLCAILSILVLTLTPVEWGQDSHSHTSVSTPESRWSELVGSMHVMHAAMTSVQPTGDNDADFVRLMLPHHQAAIDMAKTQLAYGQDPQMRRLAQEIITDQQSEIELMQLWLRQREAKASTVKHSPGVHAGKEQ